MAMIKKVDASSCKMLSSFVTRMNSTTTASRAAVNMPVHNSIPTATGDGEVEIFDFEDTRRLFASVPTRKLLHSAITLNVCAMERMVDFTIGVMNSRMMETNRVFREAVLKVIRHSAYDHFVAGADTVEAGRTVNRLWESGLRGMLDYGLEHAVDNKSCDENTRELIKTAESAHALPTSSVDFSNPNQPTIDCQYRNAGAFLTHSAVVAMGVRLGSNQKPFDIVQTCSHPLPAELHAIAVIPVKLINHFKPKS